MNNFNKVFLVIKKKCTAQQRFAEISCCPTIAKEAGVSNDRLPSYLAHLQDMGLIKYSIADNYIHLTAKGHKEDNVSELVIKSF